jgi:hypothetical protein
VDATVGRPVTTKFLAATLWRCRGSDRRSKKRSACGTDDCALCVATYGLAGERAGARTQQRARPGTLLLFARCATGECHCHQGCGNGDLAKFHFSFLSDISPAAACGLNRAEK